MLPVTIFLAGTCGETHWRRDLKKHLLIRETDILYGENVEVGESLYLKKAVKNLLFPKSYDICICCVTPAMPLDYNILAIYNFLDALNPHALNYFTYLTTDDGYDYSTHVMGDRYVCGILALSKILSLKGVHILPGLTYQNGINQIAKHLLQILIPTR